MALHPPIETLPRSEAPGPLPALPRARGYLEMFDLFRVIACLAVLAQHSFIWADMSGNLWDPVSSPSSI